MANSSYHPGRPTAARKLGEFTWAVDSFRGEGTSYVVDLANRTCNCKHFETRLAGSGKPCKHILACAEQATWLEYAEKAARCNDEQLEALLAKYNDDERIAGAIRWERCRRKQERQPAVPAHVAEVVRIATAPISEAELRKVFA